MPTQLEFIGAEERWFETAVTGKSRVWSSGRIAEVADNEALLLIDTGKFRIFWATARADDGTPNPGLLPEDANADLLAFLANANSNGSRYIAADYVTAGYVF